MTAPTPYDVIMHGLTLIFLALSACSCVMGALQREPSVDEPPSPTARGALFGVATFAIVVFLWNWSRV